MMMMDEPVFVLPAATFKSAPVEKTIAEEILSLKNCIKLLEKIWLEDARLQQEIDTDGWREFIDARLYGNRSEWFRMVKNFN